MARIDARYGLFWIGALVLVGFRLLLSADLSVQVTYSPHDDSLYVERAYHLLRGEAFGPYDSRILVKYPGLSLWLAGMRTLGIPYLLSVNALYIGAGLYLVVAFLRSGASRWIALAAFGLYLFNPITFGSEWIRVIREPLATGLFVLMLAAIAHIFASIQSGRTPWIHLALLAPAFAFALFVREDDRLLWALLLLFAIALAWRVLRRPLQRRALVFLFVAVTAPTLVGKAYEQTLRNFVERHYGLPILHELSEGEYPRLLAAIRSIHSAKDNRMVAVTQEALGKLGTVVPIFRPVIDRLPPPGPRTYSCRIHGVCSEWANGWMAFWIRDEAYRAGLTPTLIQGQAYFREVRRAIESACRSGRLACTPKGEALVPPMELRWIAAYVAEGWKIVKSALAPDPNTPIESTPDYHVPPDVAHMFAAVTMTENEMGRGANHPDTDASPLGKWRLAIVKPYQVMAALLLPAALIAFGLRWWFFDRWPMGAMALAGSAFGLYSFLRMAALSYVAVYMGAFDPRMMFSTYAAAVVLALPFIADTFAAARAQRIGGTGQW
jgi:hypothetical protein